MYQHAVELSSEKYGGKEKGVKPITTGRSMIKRTFESKGLDYASELHSTNAMDLDKIIDWNILNGYKFFRITSGLERLGSQNTNGQT